MMMFVVAAVTVLVSFGAGELFLWTVYRNGMSFTSHGGPLVRQFERGFTFKYFDGPSRGPEVVGPKQPDDNGMPRAFGRGDTKAEAEANARTGAVSYIAGKMDFRITAPVTDWHFIDLAQF